jgi:hypothetical protein
MQARNAINHSAVTIAVSSFIVKDAMIQLADASLISPIVIDHAILHTSSIM